MGQHYGGRVESLVFVMDDDAASAGASRFRNVRLYETENLDFGLFRIEPFGTQDRNGTAAVEDDGATLYLAGNTWKRLALPYRVTPGTVLEFEFQSDKEGEIHALGFETDAAPSARRFFRLYGTQPWGLSGYRYAGTGAWVAYRIPVGQHYRGRVASLVFAMDDDAASAGESRFRHVRISESTP